jgi:hypothetical protein
MSTKKSTEKFDFHSITTVEKAFEKCGYDPKAMPDLSGLPEQIRNALLSAYLLMVVFEAINDGWQPDSTDRDQVRYFPWPDVSRSGLGFSRSHFDFDFGPTSALVGSRLCTDSSAKALFILDQFQDLWKTWLLGVKID